MPDAEIIPPPPPAAPPIVPGPVVAPSGPVWPRVLGIVAIVVGSLGAFGGASAIFAAVVFFLPIMPGEMGDWQAHWRWWMLVDGAARTGLSCLLLAVGVGLVNHRRWAASSALLWGGLRLVWALTQAAMSVPMVTGQMRAVSAQGGGVPTWLGSSMAALTALFTLAWGVAPAVFVLIWFTRPRVREHTSQWS
jgi:hypothetical protein